MTAYDPAFYDAIGSTSARSSAVVLPLVSEVVAFDSCIDIGCGTGEWLHSAAAVGAANVVGVDGDHVDRNALKIAPDRFVSHDLLSTLPDVGRFDLAMSLEVAEHLPNTRAASFVAELCALSDVVLFSAAAPGQGGTNHVNEQWPSYWVRLFAASEYETFDIVRPWVWDDERVGFWFRQNTFVAINSERADLIQRANELAATAPPRWDTPSVEMLQQQVRRAQTARSVGDAATELVKAVTRPARREIARRRRLRQQ